MKTNEEYKELSDKLKKAIDLLKDIHFQCKVNEDDDYEFVMDLCCSIENKIKRFLNDEKIKQFLENDLETRKRNLVPIDKDYCDIYTVKEFEKRCKDEDFIDDDGEGSPIYEINGELFYDLNVFIHPSDFTSGKKIKRDYTKIAWFNK